MPNRNYEAGARLERDTVKNLKEHGYVVFRAAGSKGIADVIAFKPGEVLFVQAKTKGAITRIERLALFRLAGIVPGGVAIVATRPRTTYLRLAGIGPRDMVRWTPDVLA